MIYDDPAKILPWQMNLKQLEEFFPILQQSTAQPISIIEDGYQLPTAVARTIVFSGDVRTQFLPSTENVGLEYRMINVTSHDVIVQYKYKPKGSLTYKLQKYVVNAGGVWIFRYNGKTWNGYDVNNFHTINSDSGIITPTSDKIIMFDLGDTEDVKKKNHIFQLQSGLEPGIDLQFINKTKAYVFVVYNDGQYLTLPPLCPHRGELSWNGSVWENFTIDEWVMPSKTDSEANKYAIKKDTLYSRLHVMPATGGHAENYVKLSADNLKGTEIECFLDDACSYSDDINQTNPHTTGTNQVNEIAFVSTDDVIPGSIVSTCSLSTIINSCTIRFDQTGQYVFDQVSSASVASIDLTKDSTDHISIGGIHRSIEVFITGASSERYKLNLFQHENPESTEISDIPWGTKIQIRNESNNDIEVHYYRDDNTKVTDIEIPAGYQKSLIYWHNKFELYKPMSITANVIGPNNGGHILTSIHETGDGMKMRGGMPMDYTGAKLSYTTEHPDTNVKFKIKAGTRIQFGFDVGHVYTFETKEDKIFDCHGLPSPDGSYTNFTYFDGDNNVVALTEVPKYGLIMETDEHDAFCKPFTNDTVGKDLYIYAVAGLYGTHSLGVDFVTSSFVPEVFQKYLNEVCGIHALSYIVGGFHYGVRRHVTNDYVAICKTTNAAPGDVVVDNWGREDVSTDTVWSLAENGIILASNNYVSTWIKNISVGPIPNSFWDTEHCPQCYSVEDSVHQLGGMVDVGPFWQDIYELSVESIKHVGGDNGPIVSVEGAGSYFGKEPLVNQNWYTMNAIARMIGKRLPTRTEALIGAQWAPGNNDSYDNVTGNNVKLTGCGVNEDGKYAGEDGNGLYGVSAMNLCNGNGNVSEMTATISYQNASTGSWSWNSNNGSLYFGKSYLPRNNEYCIVKGGSFKTEEAIKSVRTVNAGVLTTARSSDIGVRLVCNHKRHRQ